MKDGGCEGEHVRKREKNVGDGRNGNIFCIAKGLKYAWGKVGKWVDG